MKRLLFSLAALLALGLSAQGAAFTLATSGSFSAGANWTGGQWNG